MKRRRFITLAAAFACAPGLAQANTWSGQALGADVSVTVEGPPDLARRALADVPRLLNSVEAAFSLYHPSSELSRLNMMGRLRNPKVLMRTLMMRADDAHTVSDGLFDPSVQPVWDAIARGRDVDIARQAVGWDRVHWSDRMIELQSGQALTFNGIAQGFATDMMRHVLSRHGVTTALINIGEHAALGGPFTIGLDDPVHGHLGTRQLRDMAIATSSPGALLLDAGNPHILGPRGETPLWSTVSIEAASATMADALSTAAVFMERDRLERLKIQAGLHRITVVDADGDIQTV